MIGEVEWIESSGMNLSNGMEWNRVEWNGIEWNRVNRVESRRE